MINKIRLFLILCILAFCLSGCVPVIAGGALAKVGFDITEAVVSLTDAVSKLGGNISGYIGDLRGQTQETVHEAIDRNGISGNGIWTNFWSGCNSLASDWLGEDNLITKATDLKLTATFAADKTAQASAMARNSTAASENMNDNNSILFWIIVVVIAVVALLLFLILRKPKQPQVVYTAVPQAPVPVQPPVHHAVASADMSVNYTALLKELCRKHNKDYKQVLDSFGDDARSAVEAMRLL